MSRKIYTTITTRVIFDAEEGVDISDVINEIEYDFISNHQDADVIETEIIDFDIQDSK